MQDTFFDLPLGATISGWALFQCPDGSYNLEYNNIHERYFSDPLDAETYVLRMSIMREHIE